MKEKLKWVAIVLAVIAVMLGIDWWRLTQVVLTVESQSAETIYASSEEEVEFVVSVKDKAGKPIAGHNIYALTVGGGSFKTFYEKTDENGHVTFAYYPPQMSGYQKEKTITLKFRDESNSIFIEMYPKTEYVVELTKPEDDGGMSVGDFLD